MNTTRTKARCVKGIQEDERMTAMGRGGERRVIENQLVKEMRTDTNPVASRSWDVHAEKRSQRSW